MTKFEQVGANLQYSAASISSANNRFRYSCETCCTLGLRIDCDKCAIAATHSMVVASFHASVLPRLGLL